ncbi:SDR family NAD(P)-dependent oxidoreductase [Mesorhizobium sp. M1050]|uniref:SDR family NAD(P)-dependent oxidoreductase n=1 Tax=Mesorhizobium sp. M1050 TaxID=2957051 RepID=UPI00333C8F3D
MGKGGAIVNVSSQAALVALDGHISYRSSKAALENRAGQIQYPGQQREPNQS